MDRKYLDLAFDGEALDEAGAFAGYASLFDVADGFDDVVAPGAFTATLARNQGGRGVKLLWQHDASEPIGTWDSIVEDDHGLRVRGQLLLDVRRGAEAHALLKSGAIDGLSIGYSAVEAATDPETGLRRLTEVELWEISLVTFQACPGAAVVAVEGETPKTIRAFERFLRDAGGVLAPRRPGHRLGRICGARPAGRRRRDRPTGGEPEARRRHSDQYDQHLRSEIPCRRET